MREPASYIIRNKKTKEVICEIYGTKWKGWLNTEKYEAAPIMEYLKSLNKKALS